MKKIKSEQLSGLLFIFTICACFIIKADTIPVVGNHTGAEFINSIQRDSQRKLDSILNEQNKIIEKFKALQVEMTAQEVADKSKTILFKYFGIIGILITLAGIIGYKTIISYVKKLLDKKMVREGTKIIKIETEKQINLYIKENTQINQIEDRIEKKLNEQLEKNQKEFQQLTKKNIEEYEAVVKQMKESAEALNRPLNDKTNEEKIELRKLLPDKIDLSSQMTPVRNGGLIGASVGLAIADCMEYHLKKNLKKNIILSSLYIYYYARKIKGQEKGDNGAYIRDGIKVAQTRGTVTENNWLYEEKNVSVEPPKKLDESEHYFITDAKQIENLEQIKNSLAFFGPVVIGISIYNSFSETDSAIIKMPAPRENIVGAHAICLVGFDEKTKLFKFKNSWGKDWGEKGYGYIPYYYLDKFSDDGWGVKKVSDKPAEKI